MKLITMTDFVLEQEQYRLKNILTYPKILSYNKMLNYANFLKQPLTLGMFIPTDEKGNVMEELIVTTDTAITELSKLEEYQKAKERVLFEGLEVDGAKHHITMGRNIEYLANFNALTLTDSAIKQLGL